jgi:GNAT superfamily N-acetyltransferase
VNVELIKSVEEFLAVTSRHRASDPLRTNVIGSVANSVLTGRSSYESCRWIVVLDDDRAVIGEAMRTSPHLMIVSPMASEAARSLGVAVASFDDDVAGFAGSTPTVECVLEGYQSTGSVGSRRVLEAPRRELLYELAELRSPDAGGFGRLATSDDIGELASGYVAFMIEAELPTPSLVEARMSIEKSVSARALFCWEHEGSIASFAGHAPVVHSNDTVVARVGPVYTWPEHRNRGLGSAITAMISRHLVEQDARVMLFTDATNRTSNHIYQEIGYELVDEMINLRFVRGQ